MCDKATSEPPLEGLINVDRRHKAKFCFGHAAALLKFFSQKISLKTSERMKKMFIVHCMEFQALKLLKR